MQIRQYETHRLDELVAFIARLNPLPQHHIGYFGTHPADIRATLEAANPPLEQGFVLAYDNEALIGVMGMEYDTQLGRAWLFGPLLDQDVPESVADQLYRALLPVIPPEIHEHELFCDSQNMLCQALASQHDFPLHSEAAILVFTRDQLPLVPSLTLPDLSSAYIEQFVQLHDQLFPRTYASGLQIVKRPPDRAKVFVVIEQEQLLGYVAATVAPEAGSGYTDYVGVAEIARRRGVGQKLLAAVLHWMFSFPDVQQSDLTVMTTNEAALRLYQSLGFQRERVMRGYRKTVGVQV